MSTQTPPIFSPILIVSIISALFVFAVAPPLGMILIALGISAQCGQRGALRRQREQDLADARERLRREKILAAKALP